MSRIGKKIIQIPSNTEVAVQSDTVTVKGPKGTLTRTLPSHISVLSKDGTVSVVPSLNDIATRALWGTYNAHISNMIKGVNEPFKKKLIVEGVGFKADVKGEDLNLSLGYSHPIKLKIPKGLTITVEKGVITLVGVDKELVGQFAAKIRDLKKPEPYKGKGVRYEDEVIRRKQGKKTT